MAQQNGPTKPDERAESLADTSARAEYHREALRHYRRGNRFFDRHSLDSALEEWRGASRLWTLARSSGQRVAARLMHLRAALALLLTVGLVYGAVFTFFPRDPFEMFLITGTAQNNRSWWERFLETGRPQPGGSHRMGVREWWRRFRRRLEGGEENRVASRGPGRVTIDERWEELLRRYGRWGPFFNYEIDYTIISGYGLSRLNDYKNSVEVFEKGIGATHKREKLADLYQGLANAYYYQGYRLQPDGLARYDMYFVRKSTEAYHRAVSYQPRPVSYGNLGWMHFLLGDYEKAEDFSRKALEMNPGLDYVRLNLGLTYVMRDKVYDAFEVYRTIIGRDPPKDVYMGGINDLREVLRDNPGKYPFAHMMIGILSLKQGDYGRARRALQRFQTSPFLGQTWRQLARNLLREMDTRELTQ